MKPATTQTFEVTQDVCGLIKRDTVQVQIKPKYGGPPVVLTSASPTTCPNNTIALSFSNNPPGTNIYSWLPLGAFTQTANLTAMASINQNTSFTISIVNIGQNTYCPFQRNASLGISVPVYTDTPSLVSNSNPVCPKDTIVLSLLNSPPGTTIIYQWLPSSAFTFTSNMLAKSLTQLGSSYSVNISSSGNSTVCPFTRSLNISISIADTCFTDPVIPNIFTPNNDNANDLWSISFPFGYSLRKLHIYNRWGTLIYERKNLIFDKQGYALISWDGYNTSGEQCSAGIYFYVIEFLDKSGTLKKQKGHVTLLR